MKHNFLQLNENIVWPCSFCHYPELRPVILWCQATWQKPWGDICALKFDKQISSVVKSSFVQLRIISKIRSCLSFDAPTSARLSILYESGIDYCSNISKKHHTTPIPASLHLVLSSHLCMVSSPTANNSLCSTAGPLRSSHYGLLAI